jgi:hypothetical protein
MSSEIPPDPITDQFNPAAWTLPALTPEEEALLDANFVTYPITQSNTITFPTAPISQTLPDGTNTTQVATTGFVQNAITAFTSTVNTWLGIQIFSVGMTSNTINPTTTSGTLIIGNAATNTNVEIATQTGRTAVLHLGDGTGSTTSGGIHIGNGLASTNAVNILYSSTDAGSSGIINLGAVNGTINLRSPLTPTSLTYPLIAGKIGFILTGTFADVSNPTLSTDCQLASHLIPAGVWILQASCGLTSAIAGNNALIAINTTATTTDARARQMYSYSSVSASPNIASFTTQLIISINTDTTYYFMAVTNQAISPAFSWNRIIFEATRIA